MRLIEGTTLKELITSGQLGDRRSMRLLTQMGDALDAAHAKGLVHRDVKPQNILVGAGDHAYLTDFGLTKGRGGTVMTEAGHFVGTIDYIAPEQARGELATAEQRRVLAHLRAVRVPHRAATVRASNRGAHAVRPPHRPAAEAVGAAQRPSTGDRRGGGARAWPRIRPSDPASARELMLEARRALGALPAHRRRREADAGETTARARPRRPARRASPPPPTSRAGRRRGRAAGPGRGAGHRSGRDGAGGHRAGAAPRDPPVPPPEPRSGVLDRGARCCGDRRRRGRRARRRRLGAIDDRAVLQLGLGRCDRAVLPRRLGARRSTPTIAGLTLAEPIALVPTPPGSSSALLAGTTNATGPTLLPGHVHRAGHRAVCPPPTAVRLGQCRRPQLRRRCRCAAVRPR